MAKLKNPFASFNARGKLGKWLRVVPHQGKPSLQAKPEIPDIKSLAQLSWRHMYQKAVALWHGLSAAEKLSWESAGTAKHMTGFAWFMSQCLKPNPGLYLPLQGGKMSGDIDMDAGTIEDLADPVHAQDADTQAARDAAIALALADCIDSHIHGWDGSAWQKLLVESITSHNLRVRLYAAGSKISSSSISSPTPPVSGQVGLQTVAGIRLFRGATTSRVLKNAEQTPDNNDGQYFYSIGLMGYDGSTWYRLRSYGTGILKVGRAEVGLLTPRLVAPGQVKASPGSLYWVLLNPGAGNSLIEFSNDLDGLGAVVLDHFDVSREGHMLTFDPPMSFSTGIYLKTFTNMTSIIAGYL